MKGLKYLFSLIMPLFDIGCRQSSYTALQYRVPVILAISLIVNDGFLAHKTYDCCPMVYPLMKAYSPKRSDILNSRSTLRLSDKSESFRYSN